MRVLHTIGEMGTGGAESLVAELVRRGDEVGWVSEVASSGGRHEEELAHSGLGRFHRVPLSRRRPDGLVRAVRATRAAVRRADPDVVLAHNVGVTVASWLAVRSLGRRTPIATVFHGVAAEDYRASALALSVAPNAVITVSGVIRDRLLTAGLRRHAPVVISNAVSAPATPSREVARRELEAELGLAPGVPLALCAARMVVQKRHDLLVRAWTRTPGDAVLLLAGDGPERPGVEALVQERGLGGRVRVLGNRTDVPRLLAAADVFTLASDWEGLPLALLEAMACALPVVATAVDGVAEVLRDGGGLLVPPGDEQALGDALAGLLADLPTARALGEVAATVIRDHYDPAQMVRRYDQLLTTLVGRGGRARAGSPRTADEETTRP